MMLLIERRRAYLLRMRVHPRPPSTPTNGRPLILRRVGFLTVCPNTFHHLVSFSHPQMTTQMTLPNLGLNQSRRLRHSRMNPFIRQFLNVTTPQRDSHPILMLCLIHPLLTRTTPIMQPQVDSLHYAVTHRSAS